MIFIDPALVNDDANGTTAPDSVRDMVAALREVEYLMLEVSYPIKPVAGSDPGH
jgi:hypothetical protein